MKGIRLSGRQRTAVANPPWSAMQEGLLVFAVVLALAVLGLLMNPGLDGLAALGGM